MFCSQPDYEFEPEPLSLRERATGALRLVGAFLTLEDDYDVDWDFPGEASRVASRVADDSAGPPARLRPDTHRSRSLTSRAPARRPGAPPPAPNPCLSPLPPRPRRAPRHGSASSADG